MVNIEELRARDIKKAKEILRAFELLGISKSDVACISDIAKLRKENAELHQKLLEIEEEIKYLKQTKIREDIAKVNMNGVPTPQEIYEQFAKSTEEFNPYGAYEGR